MRNFRCSTTAIFHRSLPARFVEDGSYLRLKTLRLGYTLPQNLLEKIQINNLGLYVQITNLFTITKYGGLDPELNSSGVSMGLDREPGNTRQICLV